MVYATREELRRAAGNLIVFGFAGQSASAELRELLREVRPAGLILFARNVDAPAQVRELIREVETLSPSEPRLIAVDQEGGRVARIRAPASEWPAMRELGRIGDPELTARVGEAIGRELAAMGITVDLAPVLDVDTNPDNPVIGDRSFGADPNLVADLGLALARGLERAGVAPCGKHFPGHGDTALDSHTHLPRVAHDLPRLRACEWVPFSRAIQGGLGAIMTAHVVIEALDPDHPATLSARALSPLRDELGFRGVVISDDLEMKAVAERYSAEIAAPRAVNAGVDLLLVCHQPELILAYHRALIIAAESQTLSHDTLLAAERRVLAWRRRFARPTPPAGELTRVGCAAHQALAHEIRVRAAQLV